MAGQLEVDERLAALRADPSTATIVLDYDGSIAPIVEDPATAVPFEGMTDVLLGLTNRFGEVLVVSGRPLSFLMRHLPVELSLVGLYGLEGIQKGERWEHPNGGAWREAIADLAAVARANGPEGMLVEPKDLSITFHYRTKPEIGDQVEAFAAGLASRAGLRMGRAKMSVELHPPIDADKGTVIESTCGDSTAVMFAGDDLGDLPAFEALDRLRMKGIATVKVAVLSDETPDEVIERADLEVEGPAGLLDLLRSLL
jgi:trehalose 6-phosphate phosphatase